MGDQNTIADMSIFPWMRILSGYYEPADPVGTDNFPHGQRALAQFVARPAVVKGRASP